MYVAPKRHLIQKYVQDMLWSLQTIETQMTLIIGILIQLHFLISIIMKKNQH